MILVIIVYVQRLPPLLLTRLVLLVQPTKYLIFNYDHAQFAQIKHTTTPLNMYVHLLFSTRQISTKLRSSYQDRKVWMNGSRSINKASKIIPVSNIALNNFLISMVQSASHALTLLLTSTFKNSHVIPVKLAQSMNKSNDPASKKVQSHNNPPFSVCLQAFFKTDPITTSSYFIVFRHYVYILII